MRQRIATVRRTLGLPEVGSDSPALGGTQDILLRAQPSELWLLLAVLTGQLPSTLEVQELVRAAKLGRGDQELRFQLGRAPVPPADLWPPVEVVSGQVVVDLHHTATNVFNTGIQRVAREAARRWARDHDVVLTGWTEGYTALRRLGPEETGVALHGVARAATTSGTDGNPLRPGALLVPWRCVHIVPELPAEPERARRYQAFATFSGSTTGLVGHDCVPLVAAETCAEGMSVGFAAFLAAAANVDRIATNSASTAAEFGGWRRMLAATGRAGPDIRAIPLGIDVHVPSAAAMEEARRLLCVHFLPVVLAVGSHEPRKNHLALLQAAELLWRDGERFTLALIGGNSWNSSEFVARAAQLQHANRPLQIFQAVSDDLLWAAYRVAYCTVFPSLHEGFGLPVMESLASGTPVITSNFGAMAENARSGGALLVDPHSHWQLADALRQLLRNRLLRDQLAGAASAVPVRSWDDYARATWEYFVGEDPGR
jgi:glycosyltransferase involved in cell wall biosynthesis